jgi:hypothetical protein
MKIGRHEMLISMTELLNRMIRTIQKPLSTQIPDAAMRELVVDLYLNIAKGFQMQSGRSLDIFSVANFARLGAILLKEMPPGKRADTEVKIKNVLKLRM